MAFSDTAWGGGGELHCFIVARYRQTLRSSQSLTIGIWEWEGFSLVLSRVVGPAPHVASSWGVILLWLVMKTLTHHKASWYDSPGRESDAFSLPGSVEDQASPQDLHWHHGVSLFFGWQGKSRAFVHLEGVLEFIIAWQGWKLRLPTWSLLCEWGSCHRVVCALWLEWWLCRKFLSCWVSLCWCFG